MIIIVPSSVTLALRVSCLQDSDLVNKDNPYKTIEWLKNYILITIFLSYRYVPKMRKRCFPGYQMRKPMSLFLIHLRTRLKLSVNAIRCSYPEGRQMPMKSG